MNGIFREQKREGKILGARNLREKLERKKMKRFGKRNNERGKIERKDAG